MRRQTSLLMALAALAAGAHLDGGAARAHGDVPVTNGVSFGPGEGGLFIGTSFGAIWMRPGVPEVFVCETLVTGTQSALDRWLWLGSGAIVGGPAAGTFAGGLFASLPGTCDFGKVADTDGLSVRELVADPLDPSAFYVAGRWDDYEPPYGIDARVMRGVPGAAPMILFRRIDAVASGLAAAEGHVYAGITPVAGGGLGTLLHSDDGGDTWEEHDKALAEGELLIPLGAKPGEPRTMWFLRATPSGSIVERSEDGGASSEIVLEVEGRVKAFAIAAAGDVVWLQGPVLGVWRSDDGGKRFAPLEGSPRGTCLGIDRGRLYACGITWEDGLALAVSDDGRTFAPVLASFDHIAGPIVCDDLPVAATMCGNELDYLEAYYGFGVEPGPEADEVEVVEAVEADVADATDAADVAEAMDDTRGDGGDGSDVVETQQRPKDDGCAAGSRTSVDAVVVVLALALGGRRARREVRA